MSNQQATMPFGKHKGKTFENVPADYLLWLHNNADNLRGALKEYIGDNLDAIEKEAAELKAQYKASKQA